jgi:hypothetical protein
LSRRRSTCRRRPNPQWMTYKLPDFLRRRREPLFGVATQRFESQASSRISGIESRSEIQVGLKRQSKIQWLYAIYVVAVFWKED